MLIKMILFGKSLYIFICIYIFIFTDCLSRNMIQELINTINNKKLIEAVKQNIILSDDTEIETYEWLDEEKYCLRVRVQYKKVSENNYRHKEDYFFFLDSNNNIQTLYVDYPDKNYNNIDKNRYVWDACDFDAHFEDVTFDGHNDLIIFLGHSGTHGTCISCVYIYENGFYRYEPTFEHIPYYKVDTENQVITGTNVNSASSTTDFVYKYYNNKFIKISEKSYQFSTE